MADLSAESEIDELEDAITHTEFMPYSLDPDPIDTHLSEESHKTGESESDENDGGEGHAPKDLDTLNSGRLGNTAW